MSLSIGFMLSPDAPWAVEGFGYDVRMAYAFGGFMSTQTSTVQRKRPVNLTLSEDVVASARRYSNNLSATVETLLTEYAQRQQAAAAERLQRARQCAGEWNAVHAELGSFADEHSTL
jgi:antitoxin CcdA